ncbi:MAG: glycosyltransferase [Rhodospirillales bacterium]|nr:glycosyltransferase [Rhodospirillales bacterium]
MQSRPIRILTFSSLFPNPEQPRHGLFVAERLRHLLATGAVETEIVAPVPWFPSRHSIFGRYANSARVPAESLWEGRRVLHPRHLVVPGPGWYLTPLLMARGARAAVARLLREGQGFDLIDAHYYYPDGIAAALLGRSLRKPVVITARGTDVALIPTHALARRWILWAARASAASVAVSAGLRDRMAAIGIDPASITVLRNGVDLDRFRPIDRQAARRRIGVDGRVLLSVGHLINRKGHDLVIVALAKLPGWSLLIVGEGPLRDRLQRRAAAASCADRVRLVGGVPQEELIDYYNAADILVLASSREGMANVLLEAAACGTPIVATRAEGSAEVVLEPEVGRLLPERSPEAIVAAVRDLETRPCDREQIRDQARRLGWEPTVAGLIALYRRVLEPGGASR